VAILKLLVCVAVCQGAGILGSIFTARNIETWYEGLARPAIAPPNWVFAPVWTTLFLLMGVSIFIVWAVGRGRGSTGLTVGLFAFQLALNILWSFLFFGLRSPGAAFVEILFLWLAILLTVVVFFRTSKAAGILLLPYLLWVAFASVLNFAFWRLNA
jgi:benzodiazapine receptor